MENLTPEDLNNIVDLWKWVAGILGAALVAAGTLIRVLWKRMEDAADKEKAALIAEIKRLNDLIETKDNEIKELNSEIKTSVIKVLTTVEQTMDNFSNNGGH